MKKGIWILSLIILLTNPCISQQPVHMMDDLGTALKSTSLNSMTKKVSNAAKQYKQYAPVPRFTAIDYAFGADLNEYLNLNGFGILYLTSLNQDSTELPIDRVYFKNNDGVLDLQLICSGAIPVIDKTTLKVFGDNRVDYYFLIPYSITQMSGDLFVDWTKTRKGFKLYQFPNDNKLEYISDSKFLIPDPKKQIKEEDLQIFAVREFQISLKK